MARRRRRRRYLSDLPDLPAEVLQAHDEGRLVFFCGAGISVPAGLPTFNGLAELVREVGGDDLGDDERDALGAGELDRFFYLRERRCGTENVRTKVIDSLETEASSPLHELILELARGRDGQFRLVTTNYDTLFEQAAKNQGLGLHWDAAPSLPVLDPARWNSVIYLHGRIDKDRDPSGVNLVLSSSDFGRAYLTERWASRFVTDLFRNYLVLFLGYSASDQVIRYVLDAFSDPRNADQETSDEQRFFALASYSRESKKEEARLAWRLKGVEPVLYKAGGRGHPRLFQRIEQWCESYRNAGESKYETACRIFDAGPANLVKTSESDLRWLLSDTGGVGARAASRREGEATVVASPEWLDRLDSLELPGGARALRQAYQNEGRAFSALVGRAGEVSRTIQLCPTIYELARWLADLAGDEHVAGPEQVSNSQKALNWVLEKGGGLHPDLVLLIRQRLGRLGRETALYRAWAAITATGINIELQSSHFARWVLDLVVGGTDWTVEVRQSLLHALVPFVKFRATPEAYYQLKKASGAEDPDLVEGTVVLRCSGELSVVESALAKVPRSRLAAVAFEVNGLLERALGLLNEYVPSFNVVENVHYRQVSDIGLNRRTRDWTFLADLSWSATSALNDDSPLQALALYQHWIHSRSATLQRLGLTAATRWANLTMDQREQALSSG